MLTNHDLSGTNPPKIQRLIEAFNAERRLHPIVERPSPVSFATLNGEQPTTNTRFKPRSLCLCGKEEKFKDCPYIIPTLRKPTQLLDPKIQAVVDEKIAKSSKLQSITNNLKRKTGQPQQSTKHEDKQAETIASSVSIPMSFSSTSMTSYKDVWFIDSASSDHITNNPKVFAQEECGSGDSIISGTGSAVIEATGKASLPVHTPSGLGLVHQHTPQMLSVSQS